MVTNWGVPYDLSVGSSQEGEAHVSHRNAQLTWDCCCCAAAPDANLRPLFGPTFLIRDGSTGGWLGNHLVISYNEPGSCWVYTAACIQQHYHRQCRFCSLNNIKRSHINWRWLDAAILVFRQWRARRDEHIARILSNEADTISECFMFSVLTPGHSFSDVSVLYLQCRYNKQMMNYQHLF